MLAKNVLEKDVSTMGKTELTDFLQQVQSLNIYSQKCYSLREEYRDKCVEENKRDQGHEIAIQNAKDYHTLTNMILNRIAARFEELRKEESVKGNEPLIRTETDNPSGDLESTTDSTSLSQKSSPRKNKNKKKGNASTSTSTTTTTKSDPIEEDPFVISTLARLGNLEIESRRDTLYTSVIDILESTMKRFNIGFTEQEFFILIQRLCLMFTGESLGKVTENGLRIFEEKLKKITKEALVPLFVQVKKDMKTQLIRVNEDGSLEKTSELDVLEKTIPVKVRLRGQDLILYLLKSQTIKDFKESLASTFKLHDHEEFINGLRKGGSFVILNRKGKVLKDHEVVKDVVKPYERLRPTLYI
jgi:hypothetical protein